MQNPEQLAELGQQIGIISAFLGAVAATLLGTLLSHPSPRRLVGAAAICAAAAATALVLAAVVSPSLVLAGVEPGSVRRLEVVRAVATVAHVGGMLLLLAALALCGWIRSRGVGLATTGFVAVAAVLAVLTVVL